MDIFYYNTPIYKEILLKFLQSTEKCYVNRTPFYFRRRAETVHAFERSSARLVLVRHGSDRRFYMSIWVVLYEKVLARLSTAWRLK